MTDAGYGQNADFRAGLTERGHAYGAGIRGDLTVQPCDASLITSAGSGDGRPPLPGTRGHP
ncbi:transposase [Streptomyces fodineus]|uniref:transposase n=1 Tax=Streptomyces fodineus TaxID=1904616 RepID=UPI00131BF3B3